jgi:hypothetical protein
MTRPTLPISLKRSGFENPVHIQRGSTTIATVYSDLEGGDQYDNAALMGAAKVMRDALREIQRLAGQRNTAEAAIASGALAEIERLSSLSSS